MYLIISVSMINLMNAKKVGKSAIRAAQLGGICMKGLAESMPPDFCWKTGGDGGVVPTGCPAGYFRFIALCHAECPAGYAWDGQISCQETCPSGWQTHSYTCFQHIFNWYFRKIFTQHLIDNFHESVPCPKGKYKSGALCYRDCGVVGSLNCGIGACSTSPEACIAAITQIVVDVVSGIVTLISLVVTLGQSAAMSQLRSTVTNGLKQIGQGGVKKAMLTAINSAKGKFLQVFIKKAVKKAQEFVKDAIIEGFTNTIIYMVCKKVIENEAAKVRGDVPEFFSEEWLATGVDMFGIRAIEESCTGEKTRRDGGIACAKSYIQAVSVLDPTGLLTIAAAFMFESCDVPESLPEPIIDQAELASYVVE